jgi:hypothetical protein
VHGPRLNIISLDEIEDFYTRRSIYRDLFHDQGTLLHRALSVGGRGHGKVVMQKAIRELHLRNPLQSALTHPIPRVDASKIRWRCAPPTAPTRPRNFLAEFQEMFGDAFSDRFGYAARLEEQLAARINKPGVDAKVHDVSHNVNVVTDRIPPHIAALPEPEQGPALVEAIFERKRRAQSD